MADPQTPGALKPQWFHILLSLAEGERHGSDIRRAVAEQSGCDVRLWPVMLYTSLDRLAAEGLIEELGRWQRPDQSGRRRYYRITKAGERTLRTEADRLRHLADAARRRLATRRRDA